MVLSSASALAGARTVVHRRRPFHDAAGNVVESRRADATYGYDAAGRLAEVTRDGVVQAEYLYDAQGRQVVRRMTGEQRTIHAVHDQWGNRIAEYEVDALAGTSTLLREYVWAGGGLAPRILAVIDAAVVHHVRADHVGRPVFATSGDVATWEAACLPFGGVRAASTGAVDLRFPGQWFQSESGLHQNWMRDYDPTTGRYLRADPLGLVNGASVHGYSLSSPLMHTDPTGEIVPAILLGMALGVAIDLALQYVENGCEMTWGDVNWARTGLSGGLGAFTGGAGSAGLRGIWGLHALKGTKAIPAYRKALGVQGRGTEIHHAIFSAGGRAGRTAPGFQHGWWNLRPLRRPNHKRIHGKWRGQEPFGAIRHWWYGTPTWLLGAELSAGAGAVAEMLDGD